MVAEDDHDDRGHRQQAKAGVAVVAHSYAPTATPTARAAPLAAPAAAAQPQRRAVQDAKRVNEQSCSGVAPFAGPIAAARPYPARCF
jgi:hypothetical protein